MSSVLQPRIADIMLKVSNIMVSVLYLAASLCTAEWPTDLYTLKQGVCFLSLFIYVLYILSLEIRCCSSYFEEILRESMWPRYAIFLYFIFLRSLRSQFVSYVVLVALHYKIWYLVQDVYLKYLNFITVQKHRLQVAFCSLDSYK